MRKHEQEDRLNDDLIREIKRIHWETKNIKDVAKRFKVVLEKYIKSPILAGHPLPLEAIAKMVGMSKSQIAFIEMRALKKMRFFIQRKKRELEDFCYD